MANVNGSAKWIIFLVSVIFALLTTAMGFTRENVKENKVEIKQNRKETARIQEDLNGKLTKVLQTLAWIKAKME